MRDKISTPRIDVTIGGVTFKNPFYVASGPTTKSVRQLVRIEETGWAAASIKLTIDPAPYINRLPRYGLFGDRNALVFTAEKRLTFEEGLELVREAKKQLHNLILMANITYAGDDGIDGWVNMAKRFEDVGADIIELNMCCPNMSYNLETTSGGSQTATKQTGASMGQHGDIASGIVAAIKSSISIPLFVKLTPEGGNIAKVAKALYDAGADAVGGTGNRLGIPVIDLDHPANAFHDLQKEISMGCHSGAWLKPLAQRDTYEIRKVCGDDKIITATGGINDWQSAVEMVLCGGNLLGVCAETLISGYDIARPMIKGLMEYMVSHDYASLDAMRGLIVPQVRTAMDLTLYDGYASISKPQLSAPCKSACPHHVPVQAYVQKVAKREFSEAYDLITGTNAMQELCALACERPCEDACIRSAVDVPVRIRDIKRFVLEYGERMGWSPTWSNETPNHHKVAVIGSGIAGLTFASEMKRHGYEVTVFEKDHEAGGSLRYVTPRFRLDHAVLDKQVEHLCDGGVQFEFDKEYGVDFTLNSLKEQGFDAVFLAVGAGSGVAEKGVTDALDYLRAVHSGDYVNASNVLVFGDNINAVDVARTAIRNGAEHVCLLTPGKAAAKSYLGEQLASSVEEGVKVIEQATLLGFDGQTAAVTLSGIETRIEADLVVTATATRLPESILQYFGGDDGGRIKVNVETGETAVPGVFAGGEAIGARNMISSIASAKVAAASADRHIRREKSEAEGIGRLEVVNREKVLERHGYIKKNRNHIRLETKSPAERAQSFEFSTRVMTEEEAVREAERCLNCGCGEGCRLCETICSAFAPCVSAPDTMEIDRDACVACGMCALRCPNNNIEMINTGKSPCSLKIKEKEENGCQF